MIDGVVDTPSLRPPSERLRVDEVLGPAVVVREDTTLREVAALMPAQHVQGVLVVNAQAQVVGVVAERQLTLSGHYLRMACAEVPEIGGKWVTTLEPVHLSAEARRKTWLSWLVGAWR